MHQRHRARFAPLLALVAVAALYRPADAKRAKATLVGVCPPTDCGVMLTQGPWICNTVQPVTGVCIQAGKRRIGFNQDGTDGCYTVTGLGTNRVSVTDGGRRGNCKDITAVTFYWDCSVFPG